MIFTAFALDGPLAGGLWQSDSHVLFGADWALHSADETSIPLLDVWEVRYTFDRVFLASPRIVPSDSGIPMPDVAVGHVWWANRIALDHAVGTLKAMGLMMRWLG